MRRWVGQAPGLSRVGALALAIALIAAAGQYLGQPVDWEMAFVFGITIGIARRWPIVMPRTGNRIVLAAGLMFEALWSRGIATAIVLVLLEFALRAAMSQRARSLWEWYRPFFVISALLAGYATTYLIVGRSVTPSHAPMLPTDTALVLQVYVYWAVLTATWTFLRAPATGRTRLGEYTLRMEQSWWVPLAYLAVTLLMNLVQMTSLPLVVPACLLLLWLQSVIGPPFTALYQDRAAAELIAATPHQVAAQREALHRVLHYAHLLGRSLAISPEESRHLGYAALLQDPRPAPDPQLPLWLPDQPTPARGEAIRRAVDEAVARIDRVGSLPEVVSLVRLRYATYDGGGLPPLAGDDLPVTAQLLTAANAVVTVMGQAGYTSAAPAVEWIEAHAASRFSPTVLGALRRLAIERASQTDSAGALPQTVRQLQGLVHTGRRSSAMAGLRRIWNQIRTQTPLAAGLPDEVMAMARLASFFASSPTMGHTAQIAVEAVGELVGAKVVLALSEGDSRELSFRCKATYGIHHLSIVGRVITTAGGGLTRAVLDQEPLQVADLGEISGELAEELAGVENVRAALFMPLVGRQRTIGVLMVGLTQYHWFTPREVSLIHLMAGQAAIALENTALTTEVAQRLDHISELKAFTDTLVDNLRTSMIVVDLAGRLTLANRAARILCATSGDLQVGMPLPEAVARICPVSRSLAGETVPEHDVVWGQAILEVESAPLHDRHGHLIGAVSLAKDMTGVRQMEQQVRRVEKLAAMGELAAGAAHEIRNPLTSIRGFIQLVQARAARGPEDEFFQIVLDEIDRIDHIIRDLLLLARPSDLQRVNTALDHLIGEVLRLQQSQFRQQHIRVVQEFDPSVGTVPIDPKMFRQLLLNLILNAIQAMPDGGTLCLSLRRSGPDTIALAVSDTGAGISDENFGRLFIPFFTTKETGTGLGLALCYGIVQAHGGRIDVQSRKGQGSTFTVILPSHVGPS